MKQLLSEGYLEAEPCRGYFVAEIEGLYQLRSPVRQSEQKSKDLQKEYRYDFTPSGVDLNSFPYNTWRKLSKECLQDDRAELFRLGDPQGEQGLRSAESVIICIRREASIVRRNRSLSEREMIIC